MRGNPENPLVAAELLSIGSGTRPLPMKSVNRCLIILTLSAIACGCGNGPHGVKKTTVLPQESRPVAKDATKEELLQRFNALAESVASLNATIELKAAAGSAYSGVIDEYHEVKGFLLASRPAEIRLIGQVPVVGKTVFDMASDGENFEVSIPPKNKFLVGPVSLERPSTKPVENLRPQHLVEALLWPEVRREEVVLLEEFNDEAARYYVLTVLRGGYQTEILRKIWFDRADLNLSRLQTYGPKGLLLSDVRYADWQPVGAEPAANTAPAAAAEAAPGGSYPRKIRIDRPHDNYRLDLIVSKIVLNEAIDRKQFKLDPPQGAELVKLTETVGDKRP
jgi:hypothetical protein